jgi:hypothetical protein
VLPFYSQHSSFAPLFFKILFHHLLDFIPLDFLQQKIDPCLYYTGCSDFMRVAKPPNFSPYFWQGWRWAGQARHTGWCGDAPYKRYDNTAQFPPDGLSTAPAAAARHLRCQNAR